MTFQELQLIKTIIKERLVEQSNGSILNEKLSESGEQPVDDIDKATMEVERKLYFTLKSRFDARMRELRDALDRIEKGTYGICLDCEEPIPPKRLKAIPTSRFCVNCQEAQERSRLA